MSYAPCKDATIQKMKYVPMFAIFFLIASTLFPLKVSCKATVWPGSHVRYEENPKELAFITTSFMN
jgi:hypothetical protein